MPGLRERSGDGWVGKTKAQCQHKKARRGPGESRLPPHPAQLRTSSDGAGALETGIDRRDGGKRCHLAGDLHDARAFCVRFAALM